MAKTPVNVPTDAEEEPHDPMPRSLGRVLEAIRGDKSQEEMHEVLKRVRASPRYRDALKRDRRRKPATDDPIKDAAAERKRGGGAVSRWENGDRSLTYGVVHHYAKYINVPTATLFVLASYYALLRNAATAADAEKAAAFLESGQRRHVGLMRLGQAFEAYASTFDTNGIRDALKGPRNPKGNPGLRERRIATINSLIAAYHGTSDLDPGAPRNSSDDD